jgi:hypothetical protein
VTASPTGNDDYVFYSEGGWSWAVPYVAGLYALACQVKPDITPAVFWAKALETGDTVNLPAKASALSAEEVDRRVAKKLDETVDRVKSMAKGRDLGQFMGEVYSQASGEKKDRLTEAEFRALVDPIVRQRETRESRPHKLGMIVNPARLMDALRQ